MSRALQQVELSRRATGGALRGLIVTRFPIIWLTVRVMRSRSAFGAYFREPYIRRYIGSSFRM